MDPTIYYVRALALTKVGVLVEASRVVDSCLALPLTVYHLGKNLSEDLEQ